MRASDKGIIEYILGDENSKGYVSAMKSRKATKAEIEAVLRCNIELLTSGKFGVISEKNLAMLTAAYERETGKTYAKSAKAINIAMCEAGVKHAAAKAEKAQRKAAEKLAAAKAADKATATKAAKAKAAKAENKAKTATTKTKATKAKAATKAAETAEKGGEQ